VLKGFTPAQELSTIALKIDEHAYYQHVPMHLVEHFGMLNRHANAEVSAMNRDEPPNFVRCLVCQVRIAVKDNSERERIVLFMICTGAYKEMFRNTSREDYCYLSTRDCHSTINSSDIASVRSLRSGKNRAEGVVSSTLISKVSFG